MTGDLSEFDRYESLSELPFPIGWPLDYVTPSDPTMSPLPAAAPPPPPVPASISPWAMATDVVLIVLAIAALVYLLQKFKYRYSLVTLFVVMSAVPIYYALAKLIVVLAGRNVVSWYFETVYFSPIAVVVAIKLYPVLLRQWRKYGLPEIDWSIFGRTSTALQHTADDYENPDDAIAAASRLDSLGDWDASIDLYRSAVQRWPEYGEYAQRCIDQIAEKQSLGHHPG